MPPLTPCSTSETMGNSNCPFLARKLASSSSFTFPCLRMVREAFLTVGLRAAEKYRAMRLGLP